MEIQLSEHIIFSLPDFTSKNGAAGAPENGRPTWFRAPGSRTTWSMGV